MGGDVVLVGDGLGLLGLVARLMQRRYVEVAHLTLLVGVRVTVAESTTSVLAEDARVAREEL